MASSPRFTRAQERRWPPLRCCSTCGRRRRASTKRAISRQPWIQGASDALTCSYAKSRVSCRGSGAAGGRRHRRCRRTRRALIMPSNQITETNFAQLFRNRSAKFGGKVRWRQKRAGAWRQATGRENQRMVNSLIAGLDELGAQARRRDWYRQQHALGMGRGRLGEHWPGRCDRHALSLQYARRQLVHPQRLRRAATSSPRIRRSTTSSTAFAPRFPTSRRSSSSRMATR